MAIEAAGGGTADGPGAASRSDAGGEHPWSAPPVVTAPVAGAGRSWLWAAFLFGIAAWMAAPAILASGPPTSPATVLGPGDAPGETEVRVLEGPRPQVWIMGGVTAPAGSQIEVELLGECECEPYVAGSRPEVNGFLVALYGGLGAFTAWRASRQSRASRTTRTARALLDRPPGPGSFWLVPVVFARGRLELRFGLRPEGEDALIGTVPLTVGVSRSDLERPLRVHGSPRSGQVIALSTEDGEQGLLPAEPVAPIRTAGASRPHPATDVVVDLLGWSEVSQAAAVGGTHRVTPTQFGSGRVPAAVVAATHVSRARWVAAGRWQRRSLLVAVGCVVLLSVTVGGGPLVLGAVVALTLAEMAFSAGSVRWADRPLAVALVEADLVHADARRVARLLLSSGFVEVVGSAPDASEPAPA